MFRFGLRVLSKAVDAKAAEAVVATPKQSSTFNYPEYLKPYFEGSESLPAVPKREEFSTDSEFANAIVSHPILAKSPTALKFYNEYMDAKRARATYDPLPGYEDKSVKINWDFYKTILPEHTIQFFQTLEKKTKESIQSWADEDKKYIDFALKKIQADQEESKGFRETILASIKDIEADKQEMETFLANLRSTTFEQLEGKYPDIEEEIYQEIEDNQWMTKGEKVEQGVDDIFTKGHAAHHH